MDENSRTGLLLLKRIYLSEKFYLVRVMMFAFCVDGIDLGSIDSY